ncbi:class I SAM-dependent methyltransferase [Verminephrobacter aporrectodeae]|uniref:class I SAM-dependent methyltransferase n=1 Tax=Verminephrobacter aporrectodeae TaxID=1110389 RepID=UPI002242FC7B|nr:class I SAM-dependent methyltransferase [Verminephrobacter aporrectodeae]
MAESTIRDGALDPDHAPGFQLQASDRPTGYINELTFTDRFHRELSPAWLNYVAMLNGIPSRDFRQPFTYLDLGCGFAQSTIVNAAAFPNAEFHACDFNLAHIEAAREHAARMGVGNVVFHATRFDELLEQDLPAFDFILMHGIYSWVDAAVRDTLQRIVARHLRDGGLVYLSYNCLPGWSVEAPLRKLMLEISQATPGDMVARVQGALRTTRHIGNPSFRYFRDNPVAVEAVEAFSKDPVNYLAHEFFNGTWKVHYSVDVADDMANAGLRYVGSATLADNHPMLVMDRQAVESIAALPNQRLRHLAEDFAVNRRFRRDVFMRGTRSESGRAPGDAVRILDDAVIGQVPGHDRLGSRVAIPRGALSFHPDFIDDLRALLAQGPLRIGDLIARLGPASHNPMEIRQNLLFLVASGALMPFALTGGEGRAA